MTARIFYLAIGEEASRGIAEKSTVGFIPLKDPSIPAMEFQEDKRQEWRGEQGELGNRESRRLAKKWSASFSTPFFTEAGSTAGMIGTILKHFFGKATSAQNASTSQYLHMLYKVADKFGSGGLGDKALTINTNLSLDGGVTKNIPYVGGRVTSIELNQEIGAPLMFAFEMIGQFNDSPEALIASPTFAAENLRADFNNLTVYQGVTRVGTGPDFTDFTFGSATQVKPDSIKISLGAKTTDKMRLEGLDHPNKSVDGEMEGTLEMKIDFEDPSSGFSSVDDWNAWQAASSETDFHLVWDTGTQAGTGDNHSLHIDLPICKRKGGQPAFSVEEESTVTLTYDLHFDAATTQYLAGILLKNTATTL